MNRSEFRSDEEFAFSLWLDEAKEYGIISGWEYEPRSFLLLHGQTYTETVVMKTKTKDMLRHLHAEATYTPDFALTLTPLGSRLLYDAFKPSIAHDTGQVWVDVKGNYNPHQSDGRFFSLVRKLLYLNHGIWVEKVIPFYKTGKGDKQKAKGLFVETFAPESMRWIKGRKVPTLSSCGKACCGIVDFIKGGGE